MNPLLYSDYFYSFTDAKKLEDEHRNLISDIAEKVTKTIEEKSNNLKSSLVIESSFLQSLMKVSKDGRNYSKEEINDHIGTNVVAVRLILIQFKEIFCNLKNNL